MADDDIHVYPVDDEQEHVLVGTGCPCGPTVEIEGATLIIIHNAFDWREVFEQAQEIIRGADGKSGWPSSGTTVE